MLGLWHVMRHIGQLRLPMTAPLGVRLASGVSAACSGIVELDSDGLDPASPLAVRRTADERPRGAWR
jgi:hypothetical protein